MKRLSERLLGRLRPLLRDSTAPTYLRSVAEEECQSTVIASQALSEDLACVNNPIAFTTFITKCLIDYPFSVNTIKGSLKIDSLSDRRLSTFIK